MLLSGLPVDARLRIYTPRGTLVRELSADGNGLAPWDGRNESGEPVASGVYVALAQGSGGDKSIRIIVQR